MPFMGILDTPRKKDNHKGFAPTVSWIHHVKRATIKDCPYDTLNYTTQKRTTTIDCPHKNKCHIIQKPITVVPYD